MAERANVESCCRLELRTLARLLFACLKPDLTSRGESRAFAVERFISTAYPTHHSDKLLAALGFIVLLFCCGA